MTQKLSYGDDVLTTLSGRRIKVLAPTPDDIVLSDVSNALSRVCRFGGQVRGHVSVAAHSVLVSKIVQDLGGSLVQQFHGLLHDADEAYVGDVISPLKQHLPQYEEVEQLWQKALGAAFGLGDALAVGDPLVKAADMMAFYTEWRDNFPERPPLLDARPSWRDANPVAAEAAEARFLMRYGELAKELGGRAALMLRRGS